MLTTDICPETLARSAAAKRRNAFTAMFFGGLLVALLLEVFSFKPVGFLAGILVGLLYANGFEYFFHRFVLHPPGKTLAYYHGLHHSTWGTPDEPLYVNFAKNPLVVMLLFALNALPILAVEYVFRAGIAPGMMAGFVVYFVAYEEIHWRIHFGGWLPSWLESARRHHLQHHVAAEERFNIFLPIFDWLFGSSRPAWKTNR
ncbi:MAG TPA: sterol desaturase family protein [Candidatus Acidoferrum sp.]|nr:sterol desaturase family protein [Candidatus Acidoferrum sp.]